MGGAYEPDFARRFDAADGICDNPLMLHSPRTPRIAAVLALTVTFASPAALPVGFFASDARAQAAVLDTAEGLSAAAEAVASDEPVWTLAFDMKRVMDSPLANALRARMGNEGDNAQLNDFKEKSGLDPFTDISRVVLSGTSFEDQNGVILAELASAGTITKWFAEQPEHSVQAMPGGGEVHSFTANPPQGGPAAGGNRMWASVVETDAGARLLASTEEADVVRLLADGNLDDRFAPAQLEGERIFEFRAAELPANSVPAGMPGGDALGAIRSATIGVDSGEQVALNVRLDTENDTQAQQLLQTLQLYTGMVPMFLPSLGLPAEQGQSVMAILQSIQLAAEPAEGQATPGVRLMLGMPQETLSSMLDSLEEAPAAPPAP